MRTSQTPHERPETAETPESRRLVLTVGSLLDETYFLEDEERVQYLSNITRARQRAEARGEVLLFHPDQFDLTVAHLKERYVDLDETYALTTDLKKPLLFVCFRGHAQLADGWHRLAKAVLTGVSPLPCYLLTPEEADVCLALTLPPGQGIDGGQHTNDRGDRSDRLGESGGPAAAEEEA